MRGRKRKEDMIVKFHKGGHVSVSMASRKDQLKSERGGAIGSSLWMTLHVLGLTVREGESFIITAERNE